jgi:hypothetical protein
MPAIGWIVDNAEPHKRLPVSHGSPAVGIRSNAGIDGGVSRAGAGLCPLRAMRCVTPAGELKPGIVVAVWLHGYIEGRLP